MMSKFTAGVTGWFLALSVLVLGGCGVEGYEQRWEVAIKGAYQGSLSRDGNRLVVGAIHHGGSLWQVDPPARQFDWNHRPDGYTEILYTAFSPNRQYAMTADYHTLVLWDVETGENVWYWSAPARIQAVDLSADGRFALVGLSSNRAVLFDAINGGILREFAHGGPVISVSIDAEATRALTGSEDLTARLWNVQSGDNLRTFSMSNQVTLVELSDDGRQALIAPARESAEVWDIANQAKQVELPVDDHRIYSARFESNNRLLLGTTHRRLLQYDTRTGKRTGQWEIGNFWQNTYQSATVLDMTWRNDGLWVIGSDGYLYRF
ncbi:WD40 repeat domain-containing protein [Saccharospirillum salsuginis]|uniref:WD40 repeat domain-containing protein n=1 Tax=Saccharospirillum salsuginis TaxID=418750 RepID=A0A918K383_9GAMM|nr:PQQ-binding-like beta-propeller repeat protein [Saccharospirillum salsuginis]GGX47398.1 hypothetical protein GCM10007392_12800 [Saccharospirillum salsuginis]